MRKITLLSHPEEYATRAIAVIESNLETAKSSYRKIKLNSRLQEWKTFLQLLEEQKKNQEKDSNENSKIETEER